MPIKKVGLKTVTANTYTLLSEFPAEPGTIVVTNGGSFYLSPTNSASDAYMYAEKSAMIYVDNMSAVYVSSNTTQIWLAYYPATETPVPTR